MPLPYRELARTATSMGEISLRQRQDPVLDLAVTEVKLGDEFLMSSLFTVAEVALATLGLAATDGDDLDVVVGGLGLGCTAIAALDDDRVAHLRVIEALAPVIDWHRDGLVPGAEALIADPRTHLIEGDFFALASGDEPFDPAGPAAHDAILLDVDHAPDRLLHPSHASFYTPEGFSRLRSHLRPGGTFALWSDDPPDPKVTAILDRAFTTVDAHVVPFDNPYTGDRSTNTVYVAVAPS